MGGALVCGLVYAYLAFRVVTAKKRPVRTDRDQDRFELLSTINAGLNGRSGLAVARLLQTPLLFLLTPALYLGVIIAAALGSFQRYFSVKEFEAVQKFGHGTGSRSTRGAAMTT